MNPQILIEQDGRILRVKFNRTQDNGVSDSMAGALAEAVLKAHETSDCVAVQIFVQAEFAMRLIHLRQKLTRVALSTTIFSTVTKLCAAAKCR
jgi:hypothetical protein